MQAMVISGSLALVDRGVLKQDEAVIHYRYLTDTNTNTNTNTNTKTNTLIMSSWFRNICAKIWRVYSRVFHAQVMLDNHDLIEFVSQLIRFFWCW